MLKNFKGQLVNNELSVKDEFAHAEFDANKHLLMKCNLLSVLSHDISAPLHIVNNMLSRLINCSLQEKAEALRDIIQDIYQATISIEKMVHDMIKWIKCHQSSKEGHCTLGKVNICDLVQEKIAFFTSLVKNDVKIINKISQNLIVHSDKCILGIALQNLISNAVKYTAKGVIEISAQVKDGYLILSVADTGSGFPVNAEYNNDSKPGGYGIGLQLCNQLLEYYGGYISHEKNKQQGVVANIFIPLNQ